MKKRFLKVSFFCLLMACMPATFTSCKDYDDDIAVLTQQTGSLQSQVNSLEEALNANKEAAAQAAQAAADAMAAAQAAQATADQALAEAKAAQARGDEALAAAKAADAAAAAAQADALNALAAAELAKEAAATAKAEAIADVMEQVKALMDEQRALTEKELAEIAGKIEGIEKGLNELSGVLEGVNGELDDVKNEINVVADELATLKTAVEVQKATFEEFQTLINGKIETLESNYADLLKTVEGIKTTIAALQSADEELKADIAVVAAGVDANKLLIESINERIDLIENLLDALDKKIDEVKDQAFGYTDQEVAELRNDLMGVITTIEATLNGKIDLINKNISSIEAGIEAIKGDINTIKGDISAINEQITTIKGDIDRLSGFITEINGKIDEINKRLDSIDSEITNIKGSLGAHSVLISELGDKLNDVVNTLVTVFADRLTSITLIPDAYADGVPCIDFSTAVFKEMTGEGDDWKIAEASKAIRFTPENVPVSYRLSPKSVGRNTIDEVSFVEKTASILTRGGENDCILKVDGYKVENGVLIVSTSKNGDAAINKTADGKINIAALRVNQKATKIGNQTLAGAEVQSEYARVTEGVFTPTLAEVANPENHLYNTVNKAVANTYFAELPYDETLKLDSVISVCKNFNGGHTIMSDQEIDSYKLSVEYALADFNATNAPQFGTWSKVENAVVTPGFYNEEGAFDAFNKKATGKQQVYRATLKHDGKVVDVKFVKVSIIPSESEALTIPLPSHSTAISCDADDYSFTISWRDFANVLNNENIRLLNGTEFYNVYEQSTLQVSYLFGDKDLTEYVDVDFISDLDSSNPHAWGFKFNDQISAEVFPLNVDDVTTLDIKVVCTPNTRYANQSYPVLTVTTSLIFDPLRESHSKMVDRNQAYWKDATTLRVLPIQKGTANPATGQMPDKCEYYFPIFQAFMKQPVVENDALKCAAWDFRFSSEQEGEYFATKAQDGINKVNSYVLANTLGEAAFIKWPNVGNGEHLVWDETNAEDGTNAGGHNAYITLRNGDAAKALLNQGVNANVEFVAKYPNDQVLPVQSYVLEFVKPLIIKPFIIEESFKDGVLEGETGSTINTDREFVIYDFRNQPVTKASNNGLYDYYDVQEITWDVANARVGITKTGEVLSKPEDLLLNGEINDKVTTALTDAANAHMSLTHNGSELIYLNTGGVPAEVDFYIAINVSVVHKWGEFTTPVVVKVEAGDIRYNKVRK